MRFKPPQYDSQNRERNIFAGAITYLNVHGFSLEKAF